MKSNHKILLILAIIASCIGCMADVLLLYSPNGNYHIGDYTFFKDISSERLIWGHYLGVFFIPFELLGFWVVSKTFKQAGEKVPLLFFAAISFIMFPGVVYHGTLIFVAYILKISNYDPLVLEEIRWFFEPMSAILGVFFFLFSLYLLYAHIKNKTSLPKWLMYFNPGLLYLIIILIYFLIPTIGNILMVAGFNLAIGLFLLACTFALWNKISEELLD